jgi:chromosome segregation ATPase
MYAMASAVSGGILAWFIRGLIDKRKLSALQDEWQTKFDRAAWQRYRASTDTQKLHLTIGELQSLVQKHEVLASRARKELDSTREKTRSLTSELDDLGENRDRLQQEIRTGEEKLATIRYQVSELESEFERSGVFYKEEIAKSFEKRKAVETKLDDLKADRESLTNLLDASKKENESVTRALEEAERRLDYLESIQCTANELEVENGN